MSYGYNEATTIDEAKMAALKEALSRAERRERAETGIKEPKPAFEGTRAERRRAAALARGRR